LLALISPHAGLSYSGPVAAHGYSFLRGTSGLTAVVVGPSHRAAFDGVSVFAHGAFETPLGTLPVDEVAARALVDADPRIRDFASPHRDEHSLEMQLPFLQHLVPSLRVVPVLMGRQSRGDVDVLARALARVLPGRDALMVASSDLSHYHPAPVAQEMDSHVLADIARFDPEGLMDRLESSPGHACGGGPVVAVMKAARALGADRAIVLRYGDSGDAAEGDKRRVVGYVSAALSKATE
jgi:AmmeMemoRadiSam system protein B